MQLSQLYCFLAVIEEGDFHRAATRLHRTRFSVSYQVKRLEERVGHDLLTRSADRITLTQAGHVVAEQAKEITKAIDRSRRAMDQFRSQPVGALRIGTVDSIAGHLLPIVVRSLLDRHPSICPTIRCLDPRYVVDGLLSREIDVAVTANPPADPRLHQRRILDDPIWLVCGPSHPLRGRSCVTVRELEKHSLVLLPRENPTGALVFRYLRELGARATPSMTVDSVDTLKRTVGRGLGLAFLPDMALRDSQSPSHVPLWVLALANATPILARCVVVEWARRPALDSPSGALVEELCSPEARWRHVLSQHVGSERGCPGAHPLNAKDRRMRSRVVGPAPVPTERSKRRMHEQRKRC